MNTQNAFALVFGFIVLYAMLVMIIAATVDVVQWIRSKQDARFHVSYCFGNEYWGNLKVTLRRDFDIEFLRDVIREVLVNKGYEIEGEIIIISWQEIIDERL